MKLLRNGLLAILAEVLILSVIFLNAPVPIKEVKSELNYSYLKNGRQLTVEKSNNDGIRVFAFEGEGEITSEIYTLGKLDGLRTEALWVSSNKAVIKIKNKKDEILKTIYVMFSEEEDTVVISDKKDLINPELIPSKEEENKETEAEIPAQQETTSPNTTGKPVVAYVKEIKKDEDIDATYATSPAKPQSPETNDEQVNHAADQKKYDLKIEAGVVSVTVDHGSTWIKAPISGSRLQDFWLTYYRMGNQSYYLDDSIMMIAFAQKYMQPDIIVSTDQGATWQDVKLDCGNVTINQISIAPNREGGYRIALMTNSQVMLNGTSSNGIDWTFEEPIAFSENMESMLSMALMSDGTILTTTYGDVAISKDHGKTYTHLKDINPALAKSIDHTQLPYEEDGMYCIPLNNGAVAKSKDGVDWK